MWLCKLHPFSKSSPSPSRTLRPQLPIPNSNQKPNPQSLLQFKSSQEFHKFYREKHNDQRIKNYSMIMLLFCNMLFLKSLFKKGNYDEILRFLFFNVSIIIRYLNSFRTIKSIYDLLENLYLLIIHFNKSYPNKILFSIQLFLEKIAFFFFNFPNIL